MNSVCLGRCRDIGDEGGGDAESCGGAGGEDGVSHEGVCALWYSMMRTMSCGLLLEVMIVVTPAAVAISAAISFVSIPPVPRLDPRVVVLTDQPISVRVYCPRKDWERADTCLGIVWPRLMRRALLVSPRGLCGG